MQNYKNNTTQLYARYLTAISILALAGALIYFTSAMIKIIDEIPGILLTVENTSKEIAPIVSEVAAIQEKIPAILKETEETRKLLELAIIEYAKTNQQIPRILDEVEATRKALPSVIETTNNTANAILVISKEIEAGRLLVPQVLSEIEASRVLISQGIIEIEKTRKSIPPMMDRADKLVASAREAGKEASSGAVSGVFSGIFMAPFSFVGGVSKSIIGSDDVLQTLSNEDNTDIEKAYRKLLQSGEVGDKNRWSNTDSGNSGLVTLVNIMAASNNTNECRKIQIVIQHKKKEIQNKASVLCKNDSGVWDVK